jgi:hypothetical protein
VIGLGTEDTQGFDADKIHGVHFPLDGVSDAQVLVSKLILQEC